MNQRFSLPFIYQFKALFFVSVFMCLYPFTSLAGLVYADVKVLKTKDGRTKHLYFLGDHHKVGEPKFEGFFVGDIEAPKQEELAEVENLELYQHAEEQFRSFFEAVEETIPLRKDEKLTILYEQLTASSRRKNNILSLTEYFLPRENFPHICFINAEVRNALKIARALLFNKLFLTSLKEYDDVPPTIELTFNHVVVTAHRLLSELQEFQQSYPTSLSGNPSANDFDDPFYFFNSYIEEQEQRVDELEELLRSHSIDLITNVYSFVRQNKNELLVSRLNNLLFTMGSKFFDLHLFKKIFECESNHIAILSGYAHSSECCNLLVDLPCKTILSINSHLMYFDTMPTIEEHLPYMLTKQQLVHVLSEFTIFCKFLKKIYPNKTDVEIALLRNNFLNYSQELSRHLLKNRKEIFILTLLSLISILISKTEIEDIRSIQHENDKHSDHSSFPSQCTEPDGYDGRSTENLRKE